MGWSIGYDENWERDIGYGVPAFCDYPGCGKDIDRGLYHVCGDAPYGGEHGCGLYFCGQHLLPTLCERCESGEQPFEPTKEHPRWINHKLTDESWQQWRDENPEEVKKLQEAA